MDAAMLRRFLRTRESRGPCRGGGRPLHRRSMSSGSGGRDTRRAPVAGWATSGLWHQTLLGLIFSHCLFFRRSRLFQRYTACCQAPEAAANGDALRIRRPGEITAVTTTAFITQRPDESVCGCDVHRQRGAGVAACRLHAQLGIACRIFSQLNRDGIRRDLCRRCARRH